jgi:hypothetical protein
MRMFALGWAYKAHQLEAGKEDLLFPNMFSKHPQSLVGHGQAIVLPQVSDRFDFEGEVAGGQSASGEHQDDQRLVEKLPCRRKNPSVDTYFVNPLLRLELALFVLPTGASKPTWEFDCQTAQVR